MNKEKREFTPLNELIRIRGYIKAYKQYVSLDSNVVINMLGHKKHEQLEKEAIKEIEKYKFKNYYNK